MAHKTGAAYSGGHIVHGAANAMYLPKVIKFNSRNQAASRYADIASSSVYRGDSDEALVDALIAEIKEMNKQLNIARALSSMRAESLTRKNSMTNWQPWQSWQLAMHVPVPTRVRSIRSRWRNFRPAASMIQRLISNLRSF